MHSVKLVSKPKPECGILRLTIKEHIKMVCIVHFVPGMTRHLTT